jgi:hypothetical protein
MSNGITYKIVKAFDETGQLEVEYFDPNNISLGRWAYDVPIVDGHFISTTELHEDIMRRAPVWVITRKQEIQTATGFDQIKALIPPEPEPASVAASDGQNMVGDFNEEYLRAVIFQVLEETKDSTV